MKVLVVDDEPLARSRLLRMLAEIPGISATGEANDADSALERIRSDRPDVVLLDIRMPGLSGLELAASADDLPPVVFTTAYDQYALDAFEVSAIDYLLKPVRADRLRAAIDKVRRQSEVAALDPERIQALLERLEGKTGPTEPERLQARSGATTRLFDARAVTRIWASAKYSLLVHEGREFVLDESLNALESRLAAVGFFRTHRAELVNLSHVRALQTEDGATTVELSDGQSAPVSRRTVAALKDRLGIR